MVVRQTNQAQQWQEVKKQGHHNVLEYTAVVFFLENQICVFRHFVDEKTNCTEAYAVKNAQQVDLVCIFKVFVLLDLLFVGQKDSKCIDSSDKV